MIRGWLQNPAVRQAVQTALGVGLAIGVGHLISGRRWYWAVIAAFIVAIGVGSRSEVAVKALQRLAGTVVGIVAGIFLASAVSGHTDLTFALVLVCVFFAFYAFQAAYAVMTFCITLMLAMLYGLLGQFRPELLLLRLEETAAGAAVGVLVSILVLPVRQSAVFRDAARDYLDALAEAVRSAGRTENNQSAIADLRQKTQALRNSIGGIKRGWIPLVPVAYRRAARAAMQCGYLGREMLERGGFTEEQRAALLAHIDGVRHWLQGSDGTEPQSEGAEPTPRESDGPLFNAMCEALDRLRQRLAAALQG